MSKFQQVLLSLLFLLGTQGLTRVVHAQEVDRFHRYQDNSGFSCDFPQSWKFDQSTHNDRVFGDATGKYPDATIIIQVIDRSLTKLKTAKEQLEDLANQIKAVPDAAIAAQSTAPFAGQDAPFFIASYTTKDTKGVLRPFKHVQAVATTEKYFLLMSYSAPIAEFDVNLKVFQNCAATMEFKAPQGQVVPPTSEAAPPPAVTEGPKPASPSAAEQTKFWYRNTQEGFWVAVPSNWQSKETPGNAFVLEMKDPERLEGIIVWTVKLPRSVKSDLWANSWEEHLSGKVFFMEKRLVTSNLKHPGSVRGEEYFCHFAGISRPTQRCHGQKRCGLCHQWQEGLYDRWLFFSGR
jgi:hypothetical protein